MNKFDLFFIGTITVSAFLGLFRGITKEILSVLSWAGAIIFAYLGFPFFRYLAREHINNEMIADGVTILAIFVLFLVVFSIISHILSGMVKRSLLNGVDRSLGFAFGIFRAFLLIFALEIISGFFVKRDQHPDFINQSRFSHFTYKGSDILLGILPAKVQNFLADKKNKILNKDNENNFLEEDGDLQNAVEKKITDAAHKIAQEKIGKITPNLKTDFEELSKLQPKKQNTNSNTQSPQNKAKYTNTQNNALNRLMSQTKPGL